MQESVEVRQARQQSKRIHHPLVQERVKKLTQRECQRHLPFAQRQSLQQHYFQLPLLPTTTIGSFPQTTEIRKAELLSEKESSAIWTIWRPCALKSNMSSATGRNRA
ncbi:hypothetical protein [Nitrosomonas communis]|uniref:hypothetical protein n=1 Tax=Nitrosomonas communis TaxID=44574 RepID=UPI003D283F4C